MEVVETSPDGSCFFAALAIAIDGSIECWNKFPELQVRMNEYWDAYERQIGELLSGVTPGLVRFMCATNVDEAIMVKYNTEAELDKDRPTFDNILEFSKHIMRRTTWGDHACLYAFVKSLGYNCGVLIYDKDVRGNFVFLPPEWTLNKLTYIVLYREKSHYGVVRFGKLYSVPKSVIMAQFHVNNV